MPETLEEYDEILTATGYREYPKPSMICSNATAFYQKRISDETGVKFFMDCYLYEYKDYPIGIEISANFRGEKAAYRLMEYAKDSFNLAATELLFLNIWQSHNFNYSKTWEE
jgi:hypothetical protein